MSVSGADRHPHGGRAYGAQYPGGVSSGSARPSASARPRHGLQEPAARYTGVSRPMAGMLAADGVHLTPPSMSKRSSVKPWS